MSPAAYVETLRRYIADHHLDGRADLTPETPLLEWGVIDSFSLAELLAFIQERFGIAVPADDITPYNFGDLAQLSALLSRLDARPA